MAALEFPPYIGRFATYEAQNDGHDKVTYHVAAGKILECAGQPHGGKKLVADKIVNVVDSSL